MAERSTDRPPSISSSITEAETFDDNEKASSVSTADGGFTKLKSPEEMEIGDDVERAGLLPAEEQEQEKPQPPAQDNSTRTALIWMVVNTLATIGIVSACNSQFEVLANWNTCAGLYEQSNLLGSLVETCTAYFRCLPLLHNVAYALHAFPTSICNVRTKKSCN